MRILCAEDHVLICDLLKKVLTNAGHQVQCAFDGQAAWDLLSADPSAFDILITDHEMPGLTGLELVQKVRGTSFAGKIVIESGKMTAELEAAYRALRVDRIVPKTAKPASIADLIVNFTRTVSR